MALNAPPPAARATVAHGGGAQGAGLAAVLAAWDLRRRWRIVTCSHAPRWVLTILTNIWKVVTRSNRRVDKGEFKIP